MEEYASYFNEISGGNEIGGAPSYSVSPVTEAEMPAPNYSNAGKSKKKSLISRFFSDMSRLGMHYEDDVIKNMRAIPADKNLIAKPDQFMMGDLLSTNQWKVKSNKDKNFFEKDLVQKREALRNLALQPELECILDTMTNECVVYDSEEVYFANPYIDQREFADMKKDAIKNIHTKVDEVFRRLYFMLNWKTQAWDDFKRWLIEGDLAWEIVWDSLEDPKKIIGLVPLDAATLTRKFKNGKFYYVQYSGMTGRERTLLDSQIVYIQYQETSAINRQSYLERLIRPFNIYRIIEQAQLIWTVSNSSYKMKFTIPIKGMNRALGAQTLNSAMNRYREDIQFSSDTGELKINGRANMPFNREFWFPESDSGSPNIETLGGDGPDLNDNDQLKYFKEQLYRISKIPSSRFDQESGGGNFFGTDTTSMLRTEIDFSRFVTRLRNIFAQIILKPIHLQLAIDIPELKDNRQLLQAIQLKYNSYNLFAESLEIELVNKRIEAIGSMKNSLADIDREGNEVSYFSSEFLIQKYLKMPLQDIELNRKLKRKETEDQNLAGDPDDKDS